MTTHEATQLAATVEPIELMPPCQKCGTPEVRKRAKGGKYYFSCLQCASERSRAHEANRRALRRSAGMPEKGPDPAPEPPRACAKCGGPMTRYEGTVASKLNPFWQCSPCHRVQQSHYRAERRRTSADSPLSVTGRAIREYWAAWKRIGGKVVRA